MEHVIYGTLYFKRQQGSKFLNPVITTKLPSLSSDVSNALIQRKRKANKEKVATGSNFLSKDKKMECNNCSSPLLFLSPFVCNYQSGCS